MKNKVIHLFDDHIQGDTYSNLLVQFTAPFSKDFEHTKYIEDLYEFAINA